MGRHPAEKQRYRSSGGRRASRFPFPSHWLDSHEPTWDPCWRWELSAGTACFKYRTPQAFSVVGCHRLRRPHAGSRLRFPHAFPAVTDNSRPVHTPVNRARLQWQALHFNPHPGSSPGKEIVMTQNHSLQRVLLFLAIATFAIFLVPKTAFAADDDRAPYAIGLWGDLPYNSAQAAVGVPNLIADM